MLKQIIYHNDLAEEFLGNVEVPGLTRLVLDSDNRNQYLLRTPDRLPAIIQRAYAPIGMGNIYDFSETGFKKIPPVNPEHEKMLREWIAQAVLVRSKKCHHPSPNAFYLSNLVITQARDSTISGLGFATQFFQIEDSDKKPL